MFYRNVGDDIQPARLTMPEPHTIKITERRRSLRGDYFDEDVTLLLNDEPIATIYRQWRVTDSVATQLFGDVMIHVSDDELLPGWTRNDYTHWSHASGATYETF